LVDLGVIAGVIAQSGAWYTYGEDRFQGKQVFVDKINANDELFEKLAIETFAKLNIVRN
jgi:hypothetical protein